MIYSEFIEFENATILVQSIGGAVKDPVTYVVSYDDPVTAYTGTGIFYELGAAEQVARQQIQKSATGQVILNPEKVTTTIKETMKLYVTTDEVTKKEYRIVITKNPLNRGEAIIIDIVEA